MKIKKREDTRKDNTEIQLLKARIAEIDSKIVDLLVEKSLKQDELLSLQIAPFKLGDYAVALLPSGRTAKEQKCLLESENGTLYLRPVTKEGKLSGRRFSYIPIKQTYQEYLKPVEE